MQVGIPLRNIFLMHSNTSGDIKTIQELIQQASSFQSQPPYQLPVGTSNKELCGYLNFSSGTTGLPKPVSTGASRMLQNEHTDLLPQVMLSHHNIIAQCLLQQQVQTDARTMPKLAILPLYHSM